MTFAAPCYAAWGIDIALIGLYYYYPAGPKAPPEILTI
jgi:hypothetical protein